MTEPLPIPASTIKAAGKAIGHWGEAEKALRAAFEELGMEVRLTTNRHGQTDHYRLVSKRIPREP